MTSISYGQSVYDTVTVSGVGVTPTGTVTFWYSTNGGSTWNKLGDPVQLQNGEASSISITPTTGDYLFNATYKATTTTSYHTGSLTPSLCVSTRYMRA